MKTLGANETVYLQTASSVILEQTYDIYRETSEDFVIFFANVEERELCYCRVLILREEMQCVYKV